MTLTLAHYLILGAILFAIGIFGFFLNRRNLIILLMSIELMLLAANMNFVAFSTWFGDTAGQVFVFFILTVAAAEAAIGLATLVLLFRNLNTINVRSAEHTSELQSLMRISYAVFCFKKKTYNSHPHSSLLTFHQ